MRKQEKYTFGERLRERREALGFSIRDLSLSSHIPSHLIEALENGSYESFSAKVYALGTVQKILTSLNYEDKEATLRGFENEWDVAMFRTRKELTPLPGNRKSTPYLAPRHILTASIAVFVILITIFLGSRLMRFVAVPLLKIENPAKELALEVPNIRLQGTVEKESQLTVSGRTIRVGEDGKFDEIIELNNGVNALEFWVKDRFGKERKEMRYVVVK